MTKTGEFVSYFALLFNWKCLFSPHYCHSFFVWLGFFVAVESLRLARNIEARKKALKTFDRFIQLQTSSVKIHPAIELIKHEINKTTREMKFYYIDLQWAINFM